MPRAAATAKLNLALVVGPLRDDGRHELATVLQRIDLADRLAVGRAPTLSVRGFPGDTLIAGALRSVAAAAGIPPAFSARVTKRIPVAAGLGGGSSDAAVALVLANELLDSPLAPADLLVLARALGSDVPFFLTAGPQLGTGAGDDLAPLDLPQDYWVVLHLPRSVSKESTAAVYRAFDERGGADGWEERRAALADALSSVEQARDLSALPPNDLASSPLAGELRGAGAFRADVSGAGPAVYGLFEERRDALAAARNLRPRGRTWVTVPAWYG